MGGMWLHVHSCASRTPSTATCVLSTGPGVVCRAADAERGGARRRVCTWAGVVVLRDDEAAQLLHEDVVRDVVGEDDGADGLAVGVHLRLARVEARQQEARLAGALVADDAARPRLPRGDQGVRVRVRLRDGVAHVRVARVLQQALQRGSGAVSGSFHVGGLWCNT